MNPNHLVVLMAGFVAVLQDLASVTNNAAQGLAEDASPKEVAVTLTKVALEHLKEQEVVMSTMIELTKEIEQ